jgi:hypothetical protein
MSMERPNSLSESSTDGATIRYYRMTTRNKTV